MSSIVLRFRVASRQIRRRLLGKPRAVLAVPAPANRELFNSEQMAAHGKALAGTHVLSLRGKHNRLLLRLHRAEDALLDARSLLTLAVTARRRIAPAGEWLLDNFYLIEEQISTARQHLPARYSRELPRLASGASQRLPRVYDLAVEAISHGDGRVDAEALTHFIAAYQTVTALTLGELWAIPIMLRLAPIENLHRVAIRITASRRDVNSAQNWAGQMLDMAESDPKSLILVIADMARSHPPMTSAFIAELSRQLQGHGPALALALTWIEQRLTESSTTIEHLVRSENQQQAADQVSVSNTIVSLRTLGAIDWRVFVEAMSAVEQVLLRDHGGVYGAMDFASRDRYRHVVDRLAKCSVGSEAEVAQAALDLAAQHGARHGLNHPSAHVGYFLVDQGRSALEAAVAARPNPLTRARHALMRAPLLLYLGAIAVITVGVTAALMPLTQGAAEVLRHLLWLPMILVASQLATALTNGLATLLLQPKRLPRMDYGKGLPLNQRTLVIVPTLLVSAAETDALLESLEVHFLGNSDPHLHFGLLTDFADADQEVLPDDDALLRQAITGIARLNEQYPRPGNDLFFLFHRPRCWDAADRQWRGVERKRGKLADLNALLRGGPQTAFAQLVGDITPLAGAKYVITLDTDTQLPRDAARQLVGVMAHPLNQPRYSPTGDRVSGGYGILQPRMAASLAGSDRSAYGQLCGSEPGIDPYTRSVSDVYQDLFAEGSFIGKGIYDVDAFEQTMKGRFPDNRILSHDLLEGCYARSGLVSDICLFEAYPPRYAADVARQHRWIRGDWQIARWLLPRVPGAQIEGRPKRVANPLSALSRWKIFDNLRRPLAQVAWLTLLMTAWFALPNPGAWTVALLALSVLPTLVACGGEAFRCPPTQRLWPYWLSVLRGLRLSLTLVGFRLSCLPHEVTYSLDAIARTLWRLWISHRRLLEWRVVSARSRPTAEGLGGSYRLMAVAPLLAVATALGLLVLRAEALPFAAPILLLWFAAPAMAAGLSRPLTRDAQTLSGEQLLFLRRVARKTWAFFDRFVTAEDHWLPPDNHQQSPGPITAHRTSPTNIGLSLLANLSAWDFGFISGGVLLRRTQNTFDSLLKMERHRGHFYNWYDTLTLAPLPPRYISSVDSGNLAGHLLTLRAGLLALPDAPLVDARLFDGLRDTLALVMAQADAPDHEALQAMLLLINDATAKTLDLDASFERLMILDAAAQRLMTQLHSAPDSEAADWLRAFTAQCQDARSDLALLEPALTQLRRAGVVAPSLRQLGTPAALARIAHCDALAQQAAAFALLEYAFLYDPARHLLSIGYNVDDFRLDKSYYDLLASEARLACFVAIAQGQLPQESWFALGRLQTAPGVTPILLSWSGSMFEYLMPLLVMPSYEGSLLDHSCQAAVAWQIRHGQQLGLPWGISESGYHHLDASLNYQYHAFGVPGLGLKRGLGEDQVITPYASALALLVAPDAGCRNLQRLSDEGFEDRYGYFEAIDYTPTRLPPGQKHAVVQSFMAHHQGMILLALSHPLLDRPMQRRFAADPQIQATLLLLQERLPQANAFLRRFQSPAEGIDFFDRPDTAVQTPLGAHTPTPEVQLLSNGRYHVMATNAGGGYSRWNDIAVTRWREDSTCDHWGMFLYLRDTTSGNFWSAAHQPTGRMAQGYEAMFSEGRAEFRRRDGDFETYSEIVVSPEDDIELRRLRITNRSSAPRQLDVTSYAEVVLATAAADMMQPGFGNLFVQTEIIAERRAILCTRRPRSVNEPTPWMFHLLAANGTAVAALSFETDRMAFTGRGNTLAAPQAMTQNGPLSGGQGSVLDPSVAIRCAIGLAPQASTTLDWVTGVADSREAALALIDKYQDRHLANRVFDLAWTHSGVTLRQLNASDADAQLYRRLAGSVLYANAALRADAGVLMQNRRGQSGLWGYAISGDLPIVLLKISDTAHIELARQMIQCHAWWRLKGLAVDLVIWNEDHISYRQQLHDQVMALIATGVNAQVIDRPGGIFVRSAEQISSEDRLLLQAVARVIISDQRGSLAEQVNRRGIGAKAMPKLTRSTADPAIDIKPNAAITDQTQCGFSADGREYLINTTARTATPAPWVNVLANPQFGSVISESGLAYTWRENAHEFRLTPWTNDAVGSSGGEALYLRDDETGDLWSPTPQPCPSGAPHQCRHGFGYSVFEHIHGGVQSELTVYVDLHEAVKYSVLRVTNGSGRTRQLSATGYVEWVLGDLRPTSAMQVITEIDPASGALLARNGYNTEFSNRVAFFDVDDPRRSLTGDRTEFLGRNGAIGCPAALKRTQLSGRVGAALDPCGALQVPFTLANGGSREIIFRLGAGADLSQTHALIQRCRIPGAARQALGRVKDYWRDTLGTVQIETPDPAFNVMANGWLLYQTLACRLWARSGFYQSGGAFGFRDQLQDVMALVHHQPALVREHLLRCAARQYPQGDVQHWWHPPSGRGVRTRCSDDYLWLPLAVSRYVQCTGDATLLDERVAFLDGRALAPEEESYYDRPNQAGESASVYQHCVRAVEHGLRYGTRGLPLMGSGDWNDGMNLVGAEGRGESVWLGFFLHEVLTRFGALATQVEDTPMAARCSDEAAQLKVALHTHAWDGGWYRRAWFDDGTPLGSANNAECRIDSIAQSWSVLSGAGDAERQTIAMDALDLHLVRRDAQLVQLLDPPFDQSALNPGYIKGYVPGVRENGGQYTHAAIWAAMAFARLGDARRCYELLSLINPVNHGTTAEAINVYKTEPYVVAADVYARPPHTGRGGWTWYTGSAAWMYRLMLESVLGISREGSRLIIKPCIPAHWPGYTVTYRYGDTSYRIEVVQASDTDLLPPCGPTLYGMVVNDDGIAMVDDQQPHTVVLHLHNHKTQSLATSNLDANEHNRAKDIT